jgi:hypothetical protein
MRMSWLQILLLALTLGILLFRGALGVLLVCELRRIRKRLDRLAMVPPRTQPE